MKLINFAFCLLAASINVHANEADLLLDVKAKSKKMIENQCPKGNSVQDIDWVQQKISCLVDVDQYVVTTAGQHLSVPLIKSFVETTLAQSTNELKEILKQHGWLAISKFGKKTDMQAWLIVQHSDHDPEFQAYIAFLLQQLANSGETDKKNYAYLFDRVALKYQHLGLKQRYGTQYKVENNTISLLPYEGDLESIDMQRKNVGLEPLNQYLNRGKAMYFSFKN